MDTTTPSADARCSFCNRTQDEAKVIIQGSEYHGHPLAICDVCIDVCNEIIAKGAQYMQ